MKYYVTFMDYGLCYLTDQGGDNYCQYRLSTNPKKKIFFNSKKTALRALKEMYEYRENRKLKEPYQGTYWDIVAVDNNDKMV